MLILFVAFLLVSVSLLLHLFVYKKKQLLTISLHTLSKCSLLKYNVLYNWFSVIIFSNIGTWAAIELLLSERTL